MKHSEAHISRCLMPYDANSCLGDFILPCHNCSLFFPLDWENSDDVITGMVPGSSTTKNQDKDMQWPKAKFWNAEQHCDLCSCCLAKL